MPTCKRCAARYSVWTAEWGTNLCNKCIAEEIKIQAEKKREKYEAEHQAEEKARAQLKGKGHKLIFRDTTRLTFPKVCVRCGYPDPSDHIRLTIFSVPAPMSSAGDKLLKAGGALLGLAYGASSGVGIADALGGALGGAHGMADRADSRSRKKAQAKAQAVALHALPICSACLKKLAPGDIEKLSEPCLELLEPNGLRHPLFLFLRMTQGCVCLSPASAAFTQGTIDRNPNKIYRSVEECLAAHGSEEAAGTQSSNAVPVIPDIQDQNLDAYRLLYGRELSRLEAAIVYTWHSKIGKHDSISTYPDISKRKMANVKTFYPSVIDGELILGLQDSTVFGSAKVGALFTTRGIYWKSVRDSKASSIKYENIDPSSVTANSSFASSDMVFGSHHRFHFFMSNKRDFVALVFFVSDAALLSRTGESIQKQP